MKSAFHREVLAAAPVVLALVLTAWMPPGDALAQESMSLDLDRAVQLAMEHNPKTRMREDEANAGMYRRKQAIGRLLPRLSLSARYSRVSHVEPGLLSLAAPTVPGQPSDGSSISTVQLGEAVDNQYSMRLSVDQPLFAGFALWKAYQATRHAEALAHHRVRAERADV